VIKTALEARDRAPGRAHPVGDVLLREPGAQSSSDELPRQRIEERVGLAPPPGAFFSFRQAQALSASKPNLRRNARHLEGPSSTS
jgi:hypothetical protein